MCSPRGPARAARLGDEGAMIGSRGRRMLRRQRDTVELRWLSARSFTSRWYPQGIDVGTWQGRRALAVSWFRKDRAGAHVASRITLIDLQRSRHVDLSLAVEDDHGVLQPARIHAGGLAWFGDRLFASATGEGIWEFDLGDVRQLRGETARRVSGRRASRASAVVRAAVHPVALRCSFIGRVLDADGGALDRVLIGEYRTDDRGRVAEFCIPETTDDVFSQPSDSAAALGAVGIRRMQGAVRWGDRVLVSQSRGDRRPGRLWIGDPAFRTADVPLPVGTEDLALDPQDGMLWSVGEHPWQRVVRGIPLQDVVL